MLNYEHIPSAGFTLPNGAIHIDVCPDGRLLAAGKDSLWRESEPGSRRFLAVQIPAFGSPAIGLTTAGPSTLLWGVEGRAETEEIAMGLRKANRQRRLQEIASGTEDGFRRSNASPMLVSYQKLPKLQHVLLIA